MSNRHTTDMFVSKKILGVAADDPRLIIAVSFILAAAVLAVDYLSGPLIRFPILYLLPIVLVSWCNSLRWGLSFAVGMPLIHLSFSKFWVTPFRFADATINTFILIIVFASFAYLANRVANQKRELEKEIRTLKGILPICSFCKKIRNPDGTWESLEYYITRRSEAEFSHGVCPDCHKKYYPELFDR
jgi:hypothetical protein